ncbi:hypothetical protein GCM10020218_064980 [Dactylosporangium vinaceum]
MIPPSGKPETISPRPGQSNTFSTTIRIIGAPFVLAQCRGKRARVGERGRAEHQHPAARLRRPDRDDALLVQVAPELRVPGHPHLDPGRVDPRRPCDRLHRAGTDRPDRPVRRPDATRRRSALVRRPDIAR